MGKSNSRGAGRRWPGFYNIILTKLAVLHRGWLARYWAPAGGAPAARAAVDAVSPPPY